MNNLKRFLLLLILIVVIMLCGCGEFNDSADSDVGAAYPQKDAYPHQSEFLRCLPPSGWTHGVAWIVALQEKEGVYSKVDVLYLRLICRVSGEDVVIAGEGETYATGIIGGGLYFKNPYFYNDSNYPVPDFDPKDSPLVIPISNSGDKVWHYVGQRVNIPSDAECCYAQVRFKSEGDAWFQLGLDFWKNENVQWDGLNVNNTEGGATDWYHGQSDWITINTPH